MEVQNSAAESQSSDRSQPIQETDGDGVSVMAGGPADVVVGAAVDGGEVEMELGNGGGGAEMVKKKRGRPPRVQAKSPPAKIHKEEDEDVCFICFDGGSLVLCDRRGCPKAYHPACVKRDEAFFQAKAKWNCGWHICSICQKAAQHMCYTCTYSLCKGCIKKSDYVCVRGDKGFCTVCMKTIMLIENKGQGKDETAQVDFDDKSSWEYLFKVYWVYLKGKLSLTLDELTQAKNPWKGANITASVSPSTCINDGDNDLKSIPSDTSIPNLESSESKRRKTDEQIIIIPLTTEKMGTDEKTSGVACKDWATKELLDFVAHMKNGDKSMLSQYDVQELMLEYIKRNNLRDPRKKSQIICDSRLKNLFGKPRVGHFEMLKLLEFHFFIKEDLPKNTINNIARHVDPDWNGDNNNLPVVGKEKRRRNHRKGEERAPPNKLDEYAAIDVHNITLVYLRRKLMENLIVDKEEFHGKVVGSIVRIRISGSDQKQDMYRLVQVVGTSKADVPYKIGDKSADVVLEVLNLDKKETVSIDTISNQDLSEDECRRLRQSIKCGLVKRFTVGEIEEKAVALQSVRLNDWMEGEILRLNNLRDRASEKGHKKGLREYVEKLQLLKTPEERERRLREIPEVHSDPKMNPDYETDDTEEYFNKEHGEHTKPKPSVGKNTISPKKRLDFSNDVSSRSRKNEHPRHLNVVTSKERSTKSTGKINTVKEAYGPSTLGRGHNNNNQTIGINTTISNDGEIEKIWHYRDPSGKIQGPFCMVQLQKWSTTGYFPDDMRIWTNQEDESLLLNDVLKAQLENVRLTEGLTATGKVGIRKIEGLIVCTASPLSTVHPSSEKSNELTGRFYTTDLASPTPDENNGEIKHVSSVFDTVDLPSPTPKETSIREDEKVQEKDLKLLVQTQIPKTGHEWGGYSPTQVKREEWRDPASNIGQIIHSSSSPACDYSTPWNGVRETIEFSTLAEESVSDLLAEVEAKESQNGLPSPTSRRNSLVDDLFNGSFDEFSPTSGQATRSNGFSSNGGDIQPTATTNVFDFIKLENMPFKWSEMQKQPISHDVNNSTSHVQVEEKRVQTGPDHGASDTCHDRLGGSSSGQCSESSPELVQVSQRTGQKGTTAASPPPPPSLATRRVGPEVGWDPHTNTTRSSNVGWDPHQRMHDGERHNNNNSNNNNNNNRNGKSWGRQSLFGSGGGGGYSRPPPPKGQRVCKFYESGRCKKGASCNYWHP